MLSPSVVLRFTRGNAFKASLQSLGCRRALHHDGRNRLSTFWTPNKGNLSPDSPPADGHALLVRAGFLRQAQAGIFHLLPLGLRVQNKLEALIDRHMNSLGAAKVSLSSLSSVALWEKSGRLDGRNSEFFRLEDRKGAAFLLSPTHEEEITNIVAQAVNSYKDLPLRLYQISRKYRDEARPRQGLLRGREFVMKDLYTFDATDEAALTTYEAVQAAYRAIFDELGLPYLVANADSGNMGGNYSHEYHFASPKGEDIVVSCSECKYSANEELYRERVDETLSSQPHQVLYGQLKTPKPSSHAAQTAEQSESRTDSDEQQDAKIVAIRVPADRPDVNIHAVKELLPDLETRVPLTSEPPSQGRDGSNLNPDLTLSDPRVRSNSATSKLEHQQESFSAEQVAPFGLSSARNGDACPACSTGHLQINQAVEIGHTFHLGTRYSTPLGASVLNASNKEVAVSMGCHGIGVSRLVGAVATLLADAKGLNWPISIAPFNVVIACLNDKGHAAADEMYDQLTKEFAGTPIDFVLDDRSKSLGWKLSDADTIGYPFIIVLGKAWKSEGRAEIQCRRLGVKELVGGDKIAETLRSYIKRLSDLDGGKSAKDHVR